MTDTTPPQYQEIEDAFKAPEKVLDRLPDSIETRSARRNLETAYSYTKQAREKVRPDASPEPDASVTLRDTRGPAMAGWPWIVGQYGTATAAACTLTTWRWTDGTRP